MECRDTPDHLALYRPGTVTFWILQNDQGQFTPTYTKGDPEEGLSRLHLRGTGHRIFPFDYDSRGSHDHLVLYIRQKGTIAFVTIVNTELTTIHYKGTGGIGGYDLKSLADRGFAFDYDSSGMADHLVFYRPGTGTIWILKHTHAAEFTPVYQESGNGIGGYDLRSIDDRVFPFDYDRSGKADHLVLYLPGTGTVWILKNTKGVFSPVYQRNDQCHGIGGYDLMCTADRMIAFDYDRSGKLDHLVLYRPGHGTIWILKNESGVFSAVYQTSSGGIGGYDLKSTADHVLAFDYDRTGKQDHLVLYRPGHGKIWILKNENAQFSPVYCPRPGDPSNGIGGYNLKFGADRVFAFDYKPGGKNEN